MSEVRQSVSRCRGSRSTTSSPVVTAGRTLAACNAARYEDGEAVDVDLIDYHRPEGVLTMNDIASARAGPIQNPPHLGELIRESMDDVGWNVTETAARLGCERGTLSCLLNGKADVSANMALALEEIGWGTAYHWMRMQASYELAQARPERAAAELRADALHA